jgi:HSP20 family protein
MMVYDPIYDALRPSVTLSAEAFSSVDRALLSPDLLALQPIAASSFGNLPLDVYETDDALIIEAALPGFTQDDIDIVEQNGILSIRAERQVERHEENGSWLVQERSVQVFERTIPLPVEVKADKAEATLEDGVLRISFPKTEAQKSLTNRIKVSVPKLKLPKIGKKEGKVKVRKG